MSAGVVVIRENHAHPRFLLLRAFRHWDFPKGLVEPGEKPLAAAIREVEEETTIADLEFRWGTLWKETGPYNRGKVARQPFGEVGEWVIDSGDRWFRRTPGPPVLRAAGSSEEQGD